MEVRNSSFHRLIRLKVECVMAEVVLRKVEWSDLVVYHVALNDAISESVGLY
jgi:hypothetical protein